MSVGKTNEAKGACCAPLPWLPRRHMSRREWYLSIASSMADVPLAEIRRAFEGLTDKYPPVLDVNQAAEIAKLAPSTLHRKVSEGCFKDSVSRGKPLRFWRDRFVQEVMK